MFSWKKKNINNARLLHSKHFKIVWHIVIFFFFKSSSANHSEICFARIHFCFMIFTGCAQTVDYVCVLLFFFYIVSHLHGGKVMFVIDLNACHVAIISSFDFFSFNLISIRVKKSFIFGTNVKVINVKRKYFSPHLIICFKMNRGI